MEINTIKSATLALAMSLTMIAGAVNAEENFDQTKRDNDVSVNDNSENELTPFEELLIILGLAEEKKDGDIRLIAKPDCGVTICGQGVKH